MDVRIISFVKIEPGHSERIAAAMTALPEVVKVYSTAGEFDLIVELAAASPHQLAKAISAMDEIPGVLDVRSHFVMTHWEK